MCVISAVFKEEWKEVHDEERPKRPALLDAVLMEIENPSSRLSCQYLFHL